MTASTFSALSLAFALIEFSAQVFLLHGFAILMKLNRPTIMKAFKTIGYSWLAALFILILLVTLMIGIQALPFLPPFIFDASIGVVAFVTLAVLVRRFYEAPWNRAVVAASATLLITLLIENVLGYVAKLVGLV